jgi:hypothetical protein
MSGFEYEVIFIGIVVGLSLQNILSSIHKLVEAGRRVRWHWMAPAIAVEASVLTLANFWFMWLYNRAGAQHLQLTFLTFLEVALAFGLLFLLCAATLPDEVPEPGIDLEAYYYANRHRIWGFSAGFYFLGVCLSVQDAISNAANAPVQHWDSFLLATNLAAMAASITLIFARAWWLHAIWILAGAVILLAAYGPLTL